MVRVKRIKFFERFRKKKTCGESGVTPPAESKKTSAPVKKTRVQKEKDLIQWK